ncbi:MBL fold metallo-hydrolase [Faunimonas sp. B44]|uniref:MBL fold metallo-hydrolase n=1 Tax=Faunimonas sp. B44 TaxID=3461493 RepID=UPI00404489A9
MKWTRRIGNAVVSNIVESTGPTHDPAVLFKGMMEPEKLAAALQRHASWMAPNHYVPSVNRIVVTFQIWVLQVSDAVILIDTAVGNAKQRPNPRMNMLNTLVMNWLEAIGAGPEQVTHVINTHLHTDHVGWNTRNLDGTSVPTFPNARYLMPKADFDFFGERHARGDLQPSVLSLLDSVIPVVEAGLVDFIEEPFEVVPGLAIERSTGHTPGMINLHLTSHGERAVFCADNFHTPLQIAVPELNSVNDILADEARASRRAFLERVADTGTLIMPMHFGAPYCGYIRRGGPDDTFTFLPEDAGRSGSIHPSSPP